MQKNILAHGDKITVCVDFSYRHSIDMPNFEQYVFTPYASFDNCTGRKYQKLSKANKWEQIDLHSHQAAFESNRRKHCPNYRVSIGTGVEHTALSLKHNLARIRLLQLIIPGQERWDEYIAFINGAAQIVWDTPTLFWRMVSDKHGSRDFASYFEKTFSIDRTIAWRLAWTLVRASYVDKWDCVTHLLSQAQHKTKDKQQFTNTLEREIDLLKKEVL